MLFEVGVGGGECEDAGEKEGSGDLHAGIWSLELVSGLVLAVGGDSCPMIMMKNGRGLFPLMRLTG